MAIIKQNFVNIVLANLVLVLILSISSAYISVNANVNASPYNANRSDAKEKDWFVLSAKAGQTLDDTLSIQNPDPEDKEVSVYAKDLKDTEDGVFTIKTDTEENNGVGNWFQLEVNKVIIPSNKNIKLPFKIKLPNDTKDGEYAAGFGITELNPKNDTPFKIAVRKGVRAYIAVGKDFNLNTKITNLNILDPKDDDYTKIKASKQYFGKENTVLEFDVENQGNIFGVLDCKYALNYEDGAVFESSFASDIAPRVGPKKQYIITNQPYKTGKTNAILDCQTKSQNLDTEKVKFENPKTAIGDELNLNQSELDAFESSKQIAFAPQNQEKIQNETPQNTTKIDNNNVNNYFWILGGFVIFAVLIALATLFYLKNKNKKI